MKIGDRIAAAVAGGTWGAFIAWFGMSTEPYHMARDFTWPWRAARALLQGHDPYQVVAATGNYPFNVGLFYPLPAAILVVAIGAPEATTLAGTHLRGHLRGTAGVGGQRPRSGGGCRSS